MTRRVHNLATHFRAEDAYTVIGLLDQLREVLMAVYGDEIAALLQEASQQGYDSQDEGREVDGKVT